METRLRRVCAAIIEAGWLLALIVTPLFFNTYTNRVFEPDKLHLLRSIALIMAVAWLVQLLDGSWRQSGVRGLDLWRRIRTTPLVLPALVLVLAYLISTALSIVPRISFFGSYVRLQGTLSFLCYVGIFLMVLTNLRTRTQLNRLIHAIILTSVPIAFYGIIQHYGLDPLPWGGDVQQRVAANMGNPIFVAAYLIMAFFLTVERLIDSIVAILSGDRLSDMVRALVYFFVLGLQVITIVFTQSRGPWLGWFAGSYVFGMLGLRLLGRWGRSNPRAPGWLAGRVSALYLVLIGLSVVGLSFLIVLNLPQSPLAAVRKVPYVGRMGTLFSLSEGTNAVRVLIWEGVVDMMLEPHAPIQFPSGTQAPWWSGGSTAGASDSLNPIRWLVGYGPESMWVAYNRFYPPDLAHYEARNASPDRSHNETFDALVRTGALGLGAQLALFGSVFYFALRWLGLVRSRSRRSLFLALLAGGAVLGVIIPWVFDHSLRLGGLGLPSGMIFGLIGYVTLDLLLSARSDSAEDSAGEQEQAAGEGQTAGQEQTAAPRQQLLLLALFAALVAHFAEIHFGISIASTLTHFWVLSGVLVVVGMGWLREAEAPAVATAAAAEAGTRGGLRTLAAGEGRAVVQTLPVGEQREVARVVPVAEKRNGTPRVPAAATPAPVKQPARGKRAEPGRGQVGSGRSGGHGPARERKPQAAGQVAARLEAPNSWRIFLPYALIAGVITLILVWDYSINQNGLSGAFNILWSAFTTRTSPVTHQPISSPFLLLLLLITWLVGGALALAEAGRDRTWRDRAFRWGTNIAIYAGVIIGVFFIYGLWQASLTDIGTLAGMDRFKRIASFLVLFDCSLLVMGLALAATISGAETRLRTNRWFGDLPVVSLTAGAIAAVVALLIIVDVNVQIVQADAYYKQGLAYEDAGQAEGAVVLYDQAAQMEPTEDYYYLFLGRALLEFSPQAQAGNGTLPTDLSKVQTGDLLRLAESGLNTRTREDIMRAANAILVGAQRLNPLNTDHTANLARLYRTWAFARAVSPSEAPGNSALRQLVQQHPDQVDVPKLDQSLRYYEQATALSPHNALLWNEQAQVSYVKGDTQGALADLKISADLDQRYAPTFLLQGDMMADAGDKKGALAAYQHAAKLQPNDSQILATIGVYSAQLGDVQGALNAYQRAITLETNALQTAQKQLTELGTQAGADQQRQQLQSQVAAHRNQLQSIYRNEALTLRDAGRPKEALAAAQAALDNATTDQRPPLEQLVNDLKTASGTK